MSPTENQPLRIGIMGAATIAQKNGAAIAHSSSDCVVVAIASRSEERAKVRHMIFHLCHLLFYNH